MSFRPSKRSLNALIGVHPQLVAVTLLAMSFTKVDFVVTEGLRTREKQKRLVESGASQTMNSKHLVGHAVDVAALLDGEVRWDFGLYMEINNAFQQAASTLGVNIVWGGHWKTLKDGPHFQIEN